jgi:hypothetical protein
MTEYAWGKYKIPYPIIEESEDLLILLIGGAPTTMKRDRMLGRLKNGDRVQVLTTGGNWHNATVVGYDNGLLMEFEDGGRFVLKNVWSVRLL